MSESLRNIKNWRENAESFDVSLKEWLILNIGEIPAGGTVLEWYKEGAKTIKCSLNDLVNALRGESSPSNQVGRNPASTSDTPPAIPIPPGPQATISYNSALGGEFLLNGSLPLQPNRKNISETSSPSLQLPASEIPSIRPYGSVPRGEFLLDGSWSRSLQADQINISETSSPSLQLYTSGIPPYQQRVSQQEVFDQEPESLTLDYWPELFVRDQLEHEKVTSSAFDMEEFATLYCDPIIYSKRNPVSERDSVTASNQIFEINLDFQTEFQSGYGVEEAGANGIVPDESLLLLEENLGPETCQSDGQKDLSSMTIIRPADIAKALKISKKRQRHPKNPLSQTKYTRGIQFLRQNEKAPARKRQYTDKVEREEVAITRRHGACGSCRQRKVKCKQVDYNDPLRICVYCVQWPIRRLSCCRLRTEDAVLFRTTLVPEFYKTHPLVGEKYGDFYMQALREWANARPKTLRVSQDQEQTWALKIRKFVPSENERKECPLDHRGKPIFIVPWAIEDPEEATKGLFDYLKVAKTTYFDKYLDKSDPIVVDCFAAAQRMSQGTTDGAKVLDEVLNLWVGCRFLDGGWRCFGNDIPYHPDQSNPLRGSDWKSIPSYIDYQVASIIIKVLMDFRTRVLEQWQELVSRKEKRDWYVVFLATFVLIHNFERNLFMQWKAARRREHPERYMDRDERRSIHAGAKIILLHFHDQFEGSHVFKSDFDWDNSENIGSLDIGHEIVTLQRIIKNVKKSDCIIEQINAKSIEDHTKYWFLCQIFEQNWKPRQTEGDPEVWERWTDPGPDTIIITDTLGVPLPTLKVPGKLMVDP